MSVRNFLRRQVDASGSPARSSGDKAEVETRPLSEYDNLVNYDKANFPLSEIKFRFDDLSLTNAVMMNNSSNSNNSTSDALHNNNDSLDQTIATPPSPSSSQQPAAVHHKYQNVLDTLQQRRSNSGNNDESDNGAQDQQQQQVNLSSLSQDDHDASSHFAHRPAISDAKSLFFGLAQTSTPLKTSTAGDELDKLIEDIGNAKLLAGENVQYVNFPTEEESKASQSSDKTPSGSSSTTATPSATPTRQDKLLSSRKNSESSSSRSKSPKFMVPDATAAPSQAIYMSTTVPLNMKGHKISGRHKPTRQSLRHSRMIVTTSNKGFQGSSARRHNSLNIKYVWLAKFVLTLKVLIGICIVVLGAWICLFANSTPIQQNPFWAGLILIASGLLGHYLLTFKRIRATSLKAKFFWFLKANAAVIIILSVFSTTLALIYASFHYITISSDDKHCFPENHFVHGSSCICIFNYIRAENISRVVDASIEAHTDSSGLINLEENSVVANTVHFKDLSCSELTTWTHILLTSMILNLAGLCLAVCFMTQFIFGCKRRRKHYSNVRNDP